LINTLIAVRGVNSTYFNIDYFESVTVGVAGKPETFTGPTTEDKGNFGKISFKTDNHDDLKNEINELLCKPSKKEKEDKILLSDE